MPRRRHLGVTTGLRALALLLALPLLAACDLPWATASSATQSPHSTVITGTPVSLGAGAWQRVALPVPLQDVVGYTVSPRAPDTLFACTDEPAPATLWRTTDAGAHWTSFGSLSGQGTACQFSFAPDDPLRVLVQLTSGEYCAGEADYLSKDGGASWKRLPPYKLSVTSTAPYNWCQLELTHDHLFLVFSSTDPTNAASLLARSDDQGQTWTRIDGGLGDGALFFPPAIGPDNRLAMTVEHFYPRPGQATTSLWTSRDAGNTWSKTSDLPGYPGPFLLAPFSAEGPTWPTANRPLYALATEQIPSDLYRESALASGDSVHWSQVPNLPVPGVSDERHGILQVLAALPDGRLAVWGVDPHAGLPSEAAVPHPQPGFWLWLWDPITGAWQVVNTPLDVTANESCGLCWGGTSSNATDGSISVYASYLGNGTPDESPLGLFRLRIPPRA